MKTTEFSVEKGTLGELLLRNDNHHCHSLASIEGLLSSPIFRKHNAHLIDVFKEGKRMIEAGEMGRVYL